MISVKLSGVFLRITGNVSIVREYGMEPFVVNILDKRKTLVEKLVSLFRFSFSDNYIYDIAAKIRHFYDLHFLLQDAECSAYVESEQFRDDFAAQLEHDKTIFDNPDGWNSRETSESPLIAGFDGLWASLKDTYQRELPAVACSEVPDEKVVAESFKRLLSRIL